jgi:hypothetical protein
MKLFSKLLCGVMLLYASMAFAQGSYTTTTLGAAITSGSATTITVASTSGMSGSLGGNGWGIYVDREFMRIAVVVNSTTLQVIRGMAGTRGANHINGAVVWAGPLNYFTAAIPTGACTVANLTVNPIINTSNGQVYDCDSSTTEWAVQQGVFIPADYCSASTTGTAGTGNNTTILDGSVSALKVASTNAAGSHNIFTCTVNVPSRVDAIRGAKLTDLVFVYSQQGTATGLSLITPTLKSFTGPTPGTSETASSATLSTAGGTLTMTPAVASANLTAISAGQYYTEKIALGTPINLSTDLKTLVLSFEIDQSGSTATLITTPGLWVHYNVPSLP